MLKILWSAASLHSTSAHQKKSQHAVVCAAVVYPLSSQDVSGCQIRCDGFGFLECLHRSFLLHNIWLEVVEQNVIHDFKLQEKSLTSPNRLFSIFLRSFGVQRAEALVIWGFVKRMDVSLETLSSVWQCTTDKNHVVNLVSGLLSSQDRGHVSGSLLNSEAVSML